MAGLNDKGVFETPTWATIISEIEASLQQAYNNPKFTVEDNENFGQLIKTQAERENRVWEAMNQVYNVWTRNGAEGVFLDEMFALNGIFRESATSGVGDAVVQTNSSAVDSTLIVAGTLFNGNNGLQYANRNDVLVSDRVTAYKVDASSLPLDTYNLEVTNRVTGSNFTQSFTLAAGDNTSRLNFIKSLEVFLKTVNTSETNIVRDEQNLTLYYGFNTAFDLVGLSETISLFSSPSLGNRYSLVESVATKTGFHTLGSRGINAMTPVPVGYVSVTNIKPFSNGSDIETDAAFIERARDVSDNPRSATRTAIVSALLNTVEGVDKVSINKIVNNGIVEVTPIVIGGSTEDIAKELYKRQGINNQFLGEENFTVETLDGKTENIRFTRGITTPLSLRVTYKTVSNSGLSENEQTAINTNLINLSESWQLGSLIFNFSLLAAVSGSVSTNRFSQLKVEVKRSSDPDSSYSTQDFQALPQELPDLLASGIIYTQTL
ncbi:putative baseplate J/gp47 family protein [Vibrio phage 193E37-1]|nr:putative baseplate J/gp47 family protein [Vibrio phage 193E37-1]